MLPSIRQFSRQYKVGQQVIRLALKVLKNEDRIAITPRRTVVAKVQGFVVSAISNLVALVISHDLRMTWQNPEENDIRRGIEMAMAGQNDPLLIVHDPRRLGSTMPPDLLDLPVRGILLLGRFNSAVLDEYQALGVRCVLVDLPCNQRKISSVSVANEAAAFEATSRLIAMGHRRIAFVRFVQLGMRLVDMDSKERELGYRRAFREAGFPLPNNCIFNTFPKTTQHSPEVRAIFDTSPPFTAIFATASTQAKLVILAANMRGLRVPAHMSVVCFQSVNAYAGNLSGPRIDFAALGHAAVGLLSANEEYPTKLLIPGHWVDGETVAPFPQ